MDGVGTKRSRRGCTACRIRHLKCDETAPVCQRCREANRECAQTPLISQWRKPKKMRKTSASPGKGSSVDQKWVQIPSKLTFVIDNVIEDTILQPEPAQEQRERQQPQQQQHYENLTIMVDDAPSPHYSAEESMGLSQCTSNPAFSSEDLHWSATTTPFLDLSSLDCMTSLDDMTCVSGDISDLGASNTCEAEGGVSEGTSYTSEAISNNFEPRDDQSNSETTTYCSRLVNDLAGARLLRHFCQTLAPWFDVTDTNRTFQLEVPKRASKCEVLLNAVFALSALHLSRISCLEASVPEVYHSRCNTLLIPLLNNERSAADEDVLATVVILRKYEEMNVVMTGKDLEHHLVGVAALFRSPIRVLSGGLGQAAFWQFVRQDVYMSLPKQVPPRTDISRQPPLRKDTGMPDCVWSNHIVWITVCILAYCFAEKPQDPKTWQDLNQKVTGWERDKPSTYDPIYVRDPSLTDDVPFPESWLLESWHATAMQYYHISKLLLALYNPEIARTSAGLNYPRAHRNMQVEYLCLRLKCRLKVYHLMLKNNSELCFTTDGPYAGLHLQMASLPHVSHYVQLCCLVEGGSRTPENRPLLFPYFLQQKKKTAGQPSQSSNLLTRLGQWHQEHEHFASGTLVLALCQVDAE